MLHISYILDAMAAGGKGHGVLGRWRAARDRQEIQACLMRYIVGVDSGDDELLLSAYHPDAVDEHGAFVGGPRELAAMLHDAHAPLLSVQHFVGPSHIVLDGRRAEATTPYTVWLRADADRAAVYGGSYRDLFERRRGEWRIARRRVASGWSVSVPTTAVEVGA
jgi:hypothetical protein